MDPAIAISILVVACASVVLGVVTAASTALERASAVRIQALAARGDQRARLIATRVEQPIELLGPLTVSRVFASAAVLVTLAFVGARQFGPTGAVSVGLAGAVFVAVIQMTVSLLAARGPETVALRLARIVRINHLIFILPSWLLSLPSRFLARSLEAVTPDERNDIVSFVEREEATGGVEEQERRMIRGIIALEDKTAREIMIPRIDIAAADSEATIDEVATLINERGFSRIPVFRENIDDIVGIVYAKDLLRAVSNGGRSQKLVELLREPVFIPESKRLDELLTEMRSLRTHMAIVVDEYGGTAGLVTIEDLLEEIVGEIEDEYDVAGPTVDVISEDEVQLDASAPADILKELFGFEVESEDFDTVGGFLIHELGRLPAVGDEVAAGGLTIRVLSMAGRRVRRLRIVRTQPADADRAIAR
jgi:CBS domain containing-hemolysin-like protein